MIVEIFFSKMIRIWPVFYTGGLQSNAHVTKTNGRLTRAEESSQTPRLEHKRCIKTQKKDFSRAVIDQAGDISAKEAKEEPSGVPKLGRSNSGKNGIL